MRSLRVVSIVLAFALLAAHFTRAGHVVLAALLLGFPLILLARSPAAAWTVRIVLCFGALEWLRTLLHLVGERRAAGDDWVRLAVILGVVVLLTAIAALAVRAPAARTEEGHAAHAALGGEAPSRLRPSTEAPPEGDGSKVG